MTPSRWSEALDLQLDLIRRFKTEPAMWVEAHNAIALPDDTGGDDFHAALVAEDYDRCTELAAPWVRDGLIYSRILDEAATFWVSPEMSRFLNYAHQDLPQSEIRPEDIPAPAGFVYFAEPLEFDLGPGRPGVLVWTYDPDFYDGAGALNVDLFQRNESPHLCRIQTLASTKGAMTWQPSDTCDTCDKLVRAFWLLSQQRIAVTERKPVERHSRRRAERAGFNVPEDGINVVTLRRIEQRHDTGNKLVDWSHRWIVQGHWRNQWYARAGEHRPKWIDPYPKGPEDKPLVLKDKIYRWIR